jgi:UDP-N-acetylglucosamine--N-acetylmuramyl-(pentapeptide) pyrophosphoryl-undecaprenol N-acetylglucosamine transferase
MSKTVLIMAGGTGGHIFPGLAIARGLIDAGWTVTWLGGGTHSMEHRIIHAQQAAGLPIAYEAIEFGGVRGGSLVHQLAAPFKLAKALWQSHATLQRVQPCIVIGMGGYISFPAGLMARLMRIPLIVHEQNSVAGLSNRILAKCATTVFTAFPNVLGGRFIGNPLRKNFIEQPAPAVRFAHRTGALELLVVGGSLGAKGLNDIVPQALALIPPEQRPRVTHQSGAAQLEALQANYLRHNVAATCTAFIDDTASAFARADIIVARSGASTVTEIAAVGAAALFVPFPFAVDDHQTTNAKYLVQGIQGQAGAWLEQQSDLTAQMLADFLQTTTREALLAKAHVAHQLAKLDATAHIVAVCKAMTEGNQL